MKTLIITGATRGIGAAIAAKFHDENWTVINISRTVPTQLWLQSVQQDLTQPLTPDTLMQLKQMLQPASIICLIHNAAEFFNDDIYQFDAIKFQQALQLNLTAPLQLTQAIAPQLTAGSSVLWIGSTLSQQAISQALSYVTLKHAVVGMMRSLCQDMAAQKVHTCCICPGFVNSEMLTNRMQNEPELNKMIFAKQLLGRVIEPTEIADLAWFCANHPVINGSVLDAHLGQREQ